MAAHKAVRSEAERRMLEEIGKRIARWRDGIPRAVLARRSGVDLRTLFNIEAGQVSPTVTTLAAIARGLRVDLTYLVAGLSEISTGEQTLEPSAEGSSSYSQVEIAAKVREPMPGDSDLEFIKRLEEMRYETLHPRLKQAPFTPAPDPKVRLEISEDDRNLNHDRRPRQVRPPQAGPETHQDSDAERRPGKKKPSKSKQI